jgi:hypothetical protein
MGSLTFVEAGMFYGSNFDEESLKGDIQAKFVLTDITV